MLPGAFVCWIGFFRNVTLLPLLRCVEPPADAESLTRVFLAAYDNLFDRVETVARLHFEEDKLAPTRGDAFRRDGVRFENAILILGYGIQL